MKRLVKALAAIALTLAIACTLVFLSLGAARAQVTDLPILDFPNLATIAVDMDLVAAKGCAAWWARDRDPYGDWHVNSAFCQGAACNVAGTDLAAMAKARTRNVEAEDIRPCMAKLGPIPPPAWIVAPITSGQRPAYILNPDGTRGAKSGVALVTLALGDTSGPMWCNCRVRSVETTSSTYCTWAMASIEDPTTTRVTLCKATK